MTCLCFVGAMMGRRRGNLTSQGLLVAQWLAAGNRYAVIVTSEKISRLLRLIDIATTIVSRRREIDIQCLEIYGGRSIVLEEIASLLGKRAGHRLVMVLHGGALPEFLAQYPQLVKRVLRRADALVAPSAYLQRMATGAGFSAQVIPNALDLSRYPFRLRRQLRPALFWMRSFHSIWNPAMAVRVLARVRAGHPAATLVLAGQDKGLEPSVRALARELGVDRATRFCGFLDHAGKLREAEAADIFLNTNRIDNMPVAILEAAAMGLPVISTDVGGIRDLVSHQQNALLVGDDDDEAMARSVLNLLDTPDMAGRLSAGGRALAEACDWQAVRPQWEGLFDTLMSRRSGKGVDL